MRPVQKLLSSLVAAALFIVPAAAQDARWAVRTVEAQGRSEASGCAAARARAADEARKYLGLNTRGCACVPIASKSDGPSAAYRCRVSYEVLIRAGSN